MRADAAVRARDIAQHREGYASFSYMHEDIHTHTRVHTYMHTHSFSLICSLRASVRVSEVPCTESVATTLHAF